MKKLVDAKKNIYVKLDCLGDEGKIEKRYFQIFKRRHCRIPLPYRNSRFGGNFGQDSKRIAGQRISGRAFGL